MKTVTTYIAFDTTEFDNEEECREYEAEAYDTMVELDEIYHFYDKDMNRLYLATVELDEMLDNLSDVYNECEYIEKMAQPNDRMIKFNNNVLGIDLLLNYDVGMYKYNWNELKWEKID